MANFNTWSTENLVRFAEEATSKMIEQDEYIAQLQRDVTDAIEAYRVLMRKSEQSPQPHAYPSPCRTYPK